MMGRRLRLLVWTLGALALLAGSLSSPGLAGEKSREQTAKPPAAKVKVFPPKVALPPEVSQTFQEKACQVKEELSEKARSLFAREPLGFDLDTVRRAGREILRLPGRAPAYAAKLYGILLAFLGIVFYSLVGWKRVLKFLENQAQPWRPHLPEVYYDLILSVLRVVAAALVPLLLLGLYSLIQGFMQYREPWFLLTGSLLQLWALGALIIMGLREM
ncbi:MAG: hypothetical protein JRI59_11655, partial [Deltaproteobacteria bacterium]|nr:hypothetical protein [Deltaproteobacteria bacterium]